MVGSSPTMTKAHCMPPAGNRQRSRLAASIPAFVILGRSRSKAEAKTLGSMPERCCRAPASQRRSPPTLPFALTRPPFRHGYQGLRSLRLLRPGMTNASDERSRQSQTSAIAAALKPSSSSGLTRGSMPEHRRREQTGQRRQPRTAALKFALTATVQAWIPGSPQPAAAPPWYDECVRERSCQSQRLRLAAAILCRSPPFATSNHQPMPFVILGLDPRIHA